MINPILKEDWWLMGTGQYMQDQNDGPLRLKFNTDKIITKIKNWYLTIDR